jgi:hypothetical protein
MKQCGDVENQFTAYLDGLLGTGERKIVEEHLSACSHCLRKLEDLRRIQEILAGLDEIDPPPGLTEKILSRIHEGGERKEGFFRKLFFPLHIKIPVQALATVFVVVLSVYIYRSTLPEMGRFERPPMSPQVAEKRSPAVKENVPTERPVISASPEPSLRQTQAGKKEPAQRQAAAPEVAAGASSAPKDNNTAGHSGAVAERVLAPERHAADVPSFSKAAPPPGAGQIRTRGTAVREENSRAPEPVPAPPLRAESPDVRNRIAIISDNPRQTALQAATIIRSLGGTRIEETTKDGIVIVSAWIDTDVLGELKDRLKEIASVDEPKSVFVSGPKSTFIEITIRRTASGHKGNPAGR